MDSFILNELVKVSLLVAICQIWKLNKGNQIKKLNKQINKQILNLQFTQFLCILMYNQSCIGWSSMGNDKMTA